MIIQQQNIVQIFDPAQQPTFQHYLNESCSLIIPLVSEDICNLYLGWATEQTKTQIQRNNYYKYTTVKARNTRFHRPSIFTASPLFS